MKHYVGEVLSQRERKRISRYKSAECSTTSAFLRKRIRRVRSSLEGELDKEKAFKRTMYCRSPLVVPDDNPIEEYGSSERRAA